MFDRILAELTTKRGKPKQLMIDTTHLKGHRTAATLLKNRMIAIALTTDLSMNSRWPQTTVVASLAAA